MTTRRTITALLMSLALLAVTFAAWPSGVSATPAGTVQNIAYNAGATRLSWDIVLNNDATAVAGASIAFPAPGTALANTTAGSGSCTGLPAATPITCSIPANGTLTISFSVRVLQLCSTQAITVGPYTITGGGVVGTITIPRVAANVPSTAGGCLGVQNPVVYNTGTQALTWQVPTDPAGAGVTITYTFINTNYEPNCAFLVAGGPNPAPCASGAGGHTPSVPQAVTITAATPAGICGALPVTVSVNGTADCTIPPNSPAGQISFSAAMAQTCSEYLGVAGGFIVRNSPLQPATITLYPGTYNSVPGNFALCPAVVIPPVTQPAAPTAAPAAPTAIPTQVALAPLPLIVPQVFQNPALGGIFNGPRNSATPRPAVAAAPVSVAAPSAVPVLRPPSTGDAGLALGRLDN